MSATVATVLCHACTTEGRRRPTVLGEVEKRDDGAVTWYRRDSWTRRGMRLDRRNVGAQMLYHPTVAFRLPAELDVYCREHGRGRVATSVVSAARGRVSLTY